MTSGAGWRGKVSTRMRSAPAGRRVVVALVVGVIFAAGMFTVTTRPPAAMLAGWDLAALVYLVWVWVAIRRLDVNQTRELAAREALNGVTAELVVVGAGVASLLAVAFALLGADKTSGGTKAYLVGLGVLSVVLSWAVVHTVYTLRYARTYYSPPTGGIDFNEPEPPTYLDFAYFSFTIGMTFQVADTNITAKPCRRVVLHHALLAYLFGAVILAVAINLVATLLN
jgi:uncharacterized membrane protein